MSGIIRASAAAGQVDAQAGHVACLWLCWRHYAVRLLNGRVGLLLGSMWCILRLGLLCSSSFAPPSLGSQGDQSISLQQSSGKHIVPRSGLKFIDVGAVRGKRRRLEVDYSGIIEGC